MNARAAKTFDEVVPWERHFAIRPVDSWTGTGYRKRWLCWVERRIMWSADLMDGFEEFQDIGVRPSAKVVPFRVIDGGRDAD